MSTLLFDNPAVHPSHHGQMEEFADDSPPRDPDPIFDPRYQQPAAPVIAVAPSPQTSRAALPLGLVALPAALIAALLVGIGIWLGYPTTNAPEKPPIVASAPIQADRNTSERKRQTLLAEIKERFQRTQEEVSAPRETPPTREESPPPVPQDNEIQLVQRNQQKVRAELDALLAREQSPALIPLSPQQLEEAFKADAALTELRGEAERVEEQKRNRENIATRGAFDPQVQRLAAQLMRCTTKIEARRAEIARSVEQQLGEKQAAEFQVRRIALERQLVDLVEVEKRLQAVPPKPTPPPPPPPLDTTQEEARAAKQETLRKLDTEIKALESELKEVPPAPVTEEPVVAPESHSNSRLLAACSGAAIVGVSLVTLLFWFTSSGNRVTSGRNLAMGATVPVLAEIPGLKSVTDKTDFANPGPQAEAVDVLRTLLLQRSEGPLVLLVSSAVEGEGKTTLASHLAASLARGWRKTLLVDGDLRNPAIHTFFPIAQEPGLCDVLRGDSEAAEVIQPTKLSRLWVVPAGNANSHAVQALAQQDIALLLDQWRQQYDFIIIDAPPVLPFADALLIGQHVDAVVLAVRCGMSQTSSVQGAQMRLNSLNIPFLGAVVLGSTR